jgi:(p)ppGpp synthase/HD superfamily hydrolase
MAGMIQKKEQLLLAINFAATAHAGQYDQGGMPYILHPLRVMHNLDSDDQELMAIAVLHDVVEDCPVTYDDLWMRGFTQRIVEGVRGMTKVPGESVNDNLRRMMANKDVVNVKLADLRHNMDPRRLRELTPKSTERMNKYMYMYRILTLFRIGDLKDSDWSTDRGTVPGVEDQKPVTKVVVTTP